MKNYYEILGVDRNVTQEEIKKVYRKLSIKFHPDKNPDDKFFEDRFKEINEAYSILSDEGKRNEYNEEYDSFIKLHSNFREAEEHLRNEAEKVKFAKEKLEEEYERLKKEQEGKNATEISANPVGKIPNEKVEDSSNDWSILGTILLFIVSFAVIIVILPKREESNPTENTGISTNNLVDSATTTVDSVAKPFDDSDRAFLDSVSKTWGENNAIPANELPKNEFYFTIGSTKDEVLKAQGTPDKTIQYSSLGEELWYYGKWSNGTKYYSTVTFKYDKVKEYDNRNEILKVKLQVEKIVIEEQKSYSSYKDNSNETKEYPSGMYKLSEGGIIRDANDVELIRVPPNESIWVYNNDTFSKYVVGADYKGFHGRINKNYLK